MRILLQTPNQQEFIFSYDKEIKDFLDEIMFSDMKKSLLTVSGEYVMIGQIVSFKELEEK